MFRSYVKSVFRNISRSKIYFFINVAGLCIGFTVFTLIMLYVLNELNYDTFNKKANRIYRVVEIQKSTGGQVQRVAITMPALASALQSEFPEVKSTARFIPWPTVLCHSNQKRFYENGLCFADSSIFNIFTFDFVEGNPSTIMDNPYSIIIDQSTARRYFGNTDPIGKSIDIDADLGQRAFQVTGVIKDFPLDSHLHFNMIASLSVLERRYASFRGWEINDVVTYVLLRKGYQPGELDRKLSAFLKENLAADVRSRLDMYLQPLERIHLYSNEILYQVNYNKGNIRSVSLFILTSLLVIVLAGINFVNLTTALSAIRTRQVGIRKLLGSHHSHLVYQFIGESIVLSLVGLLISLPIVEALLPTFNSMMDGRIIVAYNTKLPFLAFLGLVAVIMGIIAGIYPAFYLSSFRPAELLRGRYSSSKRGVILRKVLITLQFSAAIGLVSATSIVVDQMNYIQRKPLGFNERDLVYVPLRDTQSRNKISLLKDCLLRSPAIASVSAGERTGAGTTERLVSIQGKTGASRLMVRQSYVDSGYVTTMGMQIERGRPFSGNHGSDSLSAVINESMANILGWKDPIGKKIHVVADNVTLNVIGVVKDFNYSSLRYKIDPLLMLLQPDRCKYLVVRLRAHNIQSSLHFLRQTWTSLLPDHPFEYGFLTTYLHNEYGNEREHEQLLALFALVAILVACLGLFGLTLHTTEQRTKEIGVRKVLGASLIDIVFMLSWETVRLIIIACLIAWPVAYYFMSRWLDGFAYGINLGPWTFLLSGLIVFVIAMVTLSFQTIKVGTSNPAEALRYE